MPLPILGFQPINEDYILTPDDVSEGHPLYTVPLEVLEPIIEKLRNDYNNIDPPHNPRKEVTIREIRRRRYLLIRHLNWREAIIHGYARAAEPPSQDLCNIYNPTSPDFSTLIENPYIWMRNQTDTKPLPSTTSSRPRLQRAKQQADHLRTIFSAPPIHRWISAVQAHYGHLLATQTTPAALTGVAYFNSLQERLQANHPLVTNPHGHRASILLDLDWLTGRSTAYFVVAPRLALSYLWYKTPLDLLNLHLDPLWTALQPLLPGHVEIWPLPIAGPVTFGEIGTYKEKEAFRSIERATVELLPILDRQSIPFEMPELENRFIQNHAPNWDYIIPKAVFEHDNLRYLDVGLTWNSDRIRLTRDRLGARGPIEGSRVQLRAFGSKGERTGEPRELILPSSEVIPTSLYDPVSTDLKSLAEALPTIVHAASRYPDRVKMKELWIL